MMKKSLLIVLLLGVVAGMTQADLVVINPVSADASSTDGTTYGNLPGRVVDGSGFDPAFAAIMETGDPVPAFWPGTTSNSQSFMWLTTTATTGWISFDLGEAYTISSLHVWNYNLAFVDYDRGARNVTVQYMDQQGQWIDAQAMEFAKATSETVYRGQDYALTESFDAQHVRFMISSNWGSANALGLQEVRFVGQAVPEPASLGLLGIGGALALLRRRNKLGAV